jgi:S1-C subfamily serine protease
VPGDIVTAIDDVAIDQQNVFAEVLFLHQPGDTVSVTLLRGDQSLTVPLTLSERPADA